MCTFILKQFRIMAYLWELLAIFAPEYVIFVKQPSHGLILAYYGLSFGKIRGNYTTTLKPIFAAEDFHGLQEQVMSTSSRSHKMVVRVQRIEAALAPLEKTVANNTFRDGLPRFWCVLDLFVAMLTDCSTGTSFLARFQYDNHYDVYL
ncbi:hypothetical protein HYC85_016921 [Camellia sinensis]|uniref:Uncharacterized protein n=1 Tax=Camellia sinensis TaxID=4442 RepID=A0A7J7H0Z6_CAMSI|nr:hypothetical protein HYC85_016921 [Camellia sinensis]